MTWGWAPWGLCVDRGVYVCIRVCMQDVLVAQVETADVLVLNKSDLVPPEDLASLQTLLWQLNPSATQHVTK
jgi:G3E family GTPase